MSYLEAGAFDYVAAEAAGIHARTYRDWIMRGEDRHPTRSCTPELEAFADKVRQARARSRASREIVVADRDPKFWLQHVARSKPDREGWTEPIEIEEVAAALAPYQPDQRELAEIVRVLVDAGALQLEACGDPDCRCATHASEGGGRRGDEADP